MIRSRKTPRTLLLLIIIFWITIIFGLLFLPNPFSLFSSQKTINVYSWTELIDMRKVVEFERQTGIKVNIGYFESNEELYSKIKLTRGVGYDLIVPSGYMAEQFIKEKDFLQKIDKSKLHFWPRLNPNLLRHFYDPENEYTIPYMWSIYGIGINKSYFSPDIRKDWSLIFDTTVSQAPRVLIDDIRELMIIGAYYLFGSLDKIGEQQITEIKRVLLEQKKYTLVYAEGGAPYLLASGQAPLVLVTSPYVLRVVAHNKDIDFIIPDKENPIISIDTLVIPASCTKQDLVYQFINFLFSPEVVQYHVDQTYFLPAVTDVSCKEVETSSKNILNTCARGITKFKFLKNVIPTKAINEALLFLKS
jgi:spermidine/putrescine transport system substrate-binding protein